MSLYTFWDSDGMRQYHAANNIGNDGYNHDCIVPTSLKVLLIYILDIFLIFLAVGVLFWFGYRKWVATRFKR